MVLLKTQASCCRPIPERADRLESSNKYFYWARLLLIQNWFCAKPTPKHLSSTQGSFVTGSHRGQPPRIVWKSRFVLFALASPTSKMESDKVVGNLKPTKVPRTFDKTRRSANQLKWFSTTLRVLLSKVMVHPSLKNKLFCL
jgi:hypothetical protein